MSKNFDVCLESDLPIVQQQGLNTNKDVAFGGTLGVSGAATFGSTVTVTGAISTQGKATVLAGSAPVAGGAQAVGISSTATQGVYFGSGVPTISAATGSWYMRTDGTAPTNRAYVNTGGTAWTSITTAA